MDIGFGDVVVPKPQTINYPVLLQMAVPHVYAYSLESVVAEKFEAMITLSTLNSRMKDFYDLFVLSDRYDFDGRVLQESVYETFSRRGTLLPRHHVVFSNEFAVDRERMQQWNIYLQRTGLQAPSFSEMMAHLREFLSPIYEMIIKEDEFFLIWISKSKQWIPLS